MISETIQMLLNRMDEFPEEFASGTTHRNYRNIGSLLDDTKWRTVSFGVLQQDLDESLLEVYTPEEVAVYKQKLTTLVRKQVEAAIYSNLLAPEEKPMDQLGFDFNALKEPAYHPYSGAIKGGGE